MSKYCGVLGFEITGEIKPGVWESTVVEKEVFGDLIRINRRFANSSSINGEININNEISIIADFFIHEHLQSLKYATIGGIKWIITNMEIQYPRVILSLGGIYNGN